MKPLSWVWRTKWTTSFYELESKTEQERGSFMSQFTFGNIWLYLITLQIYDPGNNMLMSMILYEEKPEL